MSNMTVLGVDGWREGWIGAEYDGRSIGWHTFPDARSILASAADVIAIDIPIGLPSVDKRRRCDEQARAQLRAARSSVFFAPPRDLIEADEMDHAQSVAWLARRDLAGISRQTHGIVKKIRDVDLCLTPAMQQRVVEAHPELAFRHMAGVDSMASKKTAAGVAHRLRALVEWLGADPVSWLDGVPDRVPVDDALDALACAWTADRFRRGVAKAFPMDIEELDPRGLRMRIVV